VSHDNGMEAVVRNRMQPHLEEYPLDSKTEVSTGAQQRVTEAEAKEILGRDTWDWDAMVARGSSRVLGAQGDC
jgi:hypothetical protein